MPGAKGRCWPVPPHRRSWGRWHTSPATSPCQRRAPFRPHPEKPLSVPAGCGAVRRQLVQIRRDGGSFLPVSKGGLVRLLLRVHLRLPASDRGHIIPFFLHLSNFFLSHSSIPAACLFTGSNPKQSHDHSPFLSLILHQYPQHRAAQDNDSSADSCRMRYPFSPKFR